jgi:hypothetical protein
MSTDKKQAGIRLPEDVLYKIRYIAAQDKRTVNSYAESLFDRAIREYEALHGPIPPGQVQVKLRGPQAHDAGQ